VTKETAAATIRALEEAFNANNFNNPENQENSSKNVYTKYLKEFKEFEKSLTDSLQNSMGSNNPMFGEDNFRLKTTTPTQGQEIYDKGQKAQLAFGKLSVAERVEFLNILKDEIGKRAEDIKVAIVADTGKPIDITKEELPKGDAWFKYATDNIKQLEPVRKKITVKGKDYENITAIKPVGVVQVIGAFNYPYALTMPGIIGGLAAGNSVVASTPDKAPNWVFPFMDAANAAVNNFVSTNTTLSGRDKEVLKEGLIQYTIGKDSKLSEKADLVHFVGGTETGLKIKAARGSKPTILELGGSSVVTVMNSEVTSDERAKAIAQEIWGGFGPATGQRCTAPRIVSVQEGEAMEVAKKLKEICEAGPQPGAGGIGNPFSSGTKIGPLVDKKAFERMEEVEQQAKALGATVHGTLKVSNNLIPQKGIWVNPVVIDWSTAKKDAQTTKEIHKIITQGEIFGPLVHLIRPVKNIDEAISVTNELDKHNLAGAIYTANKDDVTKYINGTQITSLQHNGPPKDMSPDGYHGHPGEIPIGNDHLEKYGVKVSRTVPFIDSGAERAR